MILVWPLQGTGYKPGLPTQGCALGAGLSPGSPAGQLRVAVNPCPLTWENVSKGKEWGNGCAGVLCVDRSWAGAGISTGQAPGLLWGCVILPRDTSVLREHIAVKLDYTQQLSVSDRIINLIFV